MRFRAIMAAVALSAALLACGPGPFGSPAVTPVAASQETGRLFVAAGLWEGDDPKVSFTVTPDARITDFVIEIPVGDEEPCTIRIEEPISITSASFLVHFPIR